LQEKLVLSATQFHMPAFIYVVHASTSLSPDNTINNVHNYLAPFYRDSMYFKAQAMILKYVKIYISKN